MKRILACYLFAIIILACLAGCSSPLFLNASQRLEREADQLMSEDRKSEALLAYHQATNADPSNHSAIKKLIPLYMEQERIRQAEILYERLTRQEQADITVDLSQGKPSSTAPVNFLWMNNLIQSEPVGLTADPESIAVSYKSGVVTLLKSTDGSPFWTRDMRQTITSAPGVSVDRIIIGCESGDVIALDRKSGGTLWTVNLTGSVFAPPFISDGRVYIASYSSRVTSLDLSTGKTFWQVETGDAVVGQPMLQNDILYFATVGGSVNALDANTGRPRWNKPANLGGGLETSLVPTGDMLLIAGSDSRLTALIPTGDAYYWQYSMPDSIYASPILESSDIFVFSIGQQAARLQLETGMPVWEKQLPVSVRSTPASIGERLYFTGVSQPYLFVMNKATGEIISKIHTGDWIESGPVLQGNLLLIAGKDGAVIAYRID